jgi:DUF3047 family protein
MHPRVSRLLVGMLAPLMLVWPVAAPEVARAADDDCIVLADLTQAKVGEFPADWKVRKEAGRKVYAVQEEGGTRFLRGHAQGLGIQAAKNREWDLNAYPVLAWRWRPIEFPKGADERSAATNDSAVAVYMLVPYSNIRGPKALKYVWSEKVPVGTHLESNMGLTKVRILRSGGETGKWMEERANVRDDFLKAFDTKEVPTPAGIAVLTDADDKESSAVGDYADFRACRN